MVNAFTGAVADALTVPDYVQSAALLSIEGGQSDKGTDDALQALLDLRVVDSAFYCVLAASPSHTFHPDPAKGGELRWLNLSLPKAFSPPQMTTTRKGYRVMLATTLEARWLVLDCGGVTGSERCLARSHWAKDGFDMRNAPQRGTHVNGSTSRRRRSGQAGETEAEDSYDENGLNSDDDRQPANEDSGGCSTSNSTNSTAAERNGRLTGVHSGVRDIAEECWEAIEDEFVAPAEQALATAERALETADSRLRELREQPWMVRALEKVAMFETLPMLVTIVAITQHLSGKIEWEHSPAQQAWPVSSSLFLLGYLFHSCLTFGAGGPGASRARTPQVGSHLPGRSCGAVASQRPRCWWGCGRARRSSAR